MTYHSGYGSLPPPRPERPSRGGGCLGVLGTLLIVGAVIVGTVAYSPILELDDLRDRLGDAVRMDPLHGEPGSGGDGWTYMTTTTSGAPITWGCRQTIPVEVNPEHAPEGYADRLTAAFAMVNEASGFTFEIVGETEDRNFLERGRGPVLLGWADEQEVPALAGPTAGLGGAVYAQGPGGGGRAVGGMVVLDVDQPGGWLRDTDTELEMIITHELIHVLGLGHSEDPNQLMAAEHRGQRALGEGDLAGLASLEETACG
ncbi:matrixin family metalloprotease [Ornithinimicrobium sp. Y1694]|uniref:matrixin family metalloprotease n=1 Tax=Ornithinimicrobium sp. Y1694 TaxID=3418590 RepID=UPI003CEBFC6C